MKYLIIPLLIAINLLQFSSGEPPWKWVPRFENDTANFRRITLFYEDEKWKEPKYLEKQFYPVPGGRCPVEWAKKWNGIEFGIDHMMNLDYWFFWGGAMVHLDFESDLTDSMGPKYFDVASNALIKAFYDIVQEYLDKDELKKPTTFMEYVHRFFWMG